jgi:hypothetical protein
MTSAIGKRFSLLRFSLRSLFILITAICIILGYQLEWIRRRHAFVKAHMRNAPNLERLNDYIDGSEARTSLLQTYGVPRIAAPFPLWLFGERGILMIAVPVSQADVIFPKEEGYPEAVSKEHPLVKQAIRLFPESEVFGCIDLSAHDAPLLIPK